MTQEKDLARKFYQIGRLEVVYINNRLAARQLRMEHVQLLHYVALHPGCRQKDAARYLQYQPASLTNLLKKLEADGMIKRQIDPQNRHQKQIFLLSKGKKTLSDIDSHFATLNAILRQIDLSKPQALEHLINHLLQFVQAEK